MSQRESSAGACNSATGAAKAGKPGKASSKLNAGTLLADELDADADEVTLLLELALDMALEPPPQAASVALIRTTATSRRKGCCMSITPA
jgi:hypothetical protein